MTASLVLQAGGGALSGGEGGEGGLPWDLVFYYEPAIISASSRIRLVHVHTFTYTVSGVVVYIL